jgi:hypothetical protein
MRVSTSTFLTHSTYVAIGPSPVSSSCFLFRSSHILRRLFRACSLSGRQRALGLSMFHFSARRFHLQIHNLLRAVKIYCCCSDVVDVLDYVPPSKPSTPGGLHVTNSISGASSHALTTTMLFFVAINLPCRLAFLLPHVMRALFGFKLCGPSVRSSPGCLRTNLAFTSPIRNLGAGVSLSSNSFSSSFQN